MSTTGGRWEARRLLALLTAFAAAISMTVVFAGTAQADSPATLPWDNAQNDADWWEDWGDDTHGESDWTCVKDETGGDGTYEIGDPPTGEVWRLVVVKAGSEYVDLFWNPASGDDVEHSQQGGWSFVILCSRPGGTTSSEPETTSSSVDETTSSSVRETTTSSVDDTTTSSVDDTTTSSVDDTT
ncbi:MAG: hypothetical protein L0Z47_09040, partial [Actinobacteria bacterium]|nr:hypothetical protein [Actinomycetota bacterium]